jgi:cobalt-precorrin-5B (C1)-methyltransferase
MTKLAQGLLDLHSKRGAVDLEALAVFATEAGGSATLSEKIREANTAAEAFTHAGAEGVALGDAVARRARTTAQQVVERKATAIEVVVFDREGGLAGRAPF